MVSIDLTATKETTKKTPGNHSKNARIPVPEATATVTTAPGKRHLLLPQSQSTLDNNNNDSNNKDGPLSFPVAVMTSLNQTNDHNNGNTYQRFGSKNLSVIIPGISFDDKSHKKHQQQSLHQNPNESSPHSSSSSSSTNSIFKSLHQSAKRFSFDLTPKSEDKSDSKPVKRSYSSLDKTSNFVQKTVGIKLKKSNAQMASSISSPAPTTPLNSNSFSIFDAVNESSQDVENNSDQKRHQTYKDRRKTYQLEKKKLADELIRAIQDPTTVVMSDWLKVRTTLKQWNKYFCELRPGSLYLYKNQKIHKPSNWIGTVMLKMCELLERPSKKNGFCFKLFHPLEHPIWSPKGPHGEEYTSFMFPLPISSVIFRALSEEAGRKWMEAIELAMNCSDLLAPNKHISSRRDSIHNSPSNNAAINNTNNNVPQNSLDRSDDDLQHQSINDLDIEKHFDLDDDGHTDHGEHDDSQGHHSTEDSDDSIFDIEYNAEAINGEQDGKSTLKHVSPNVQLKKVDSETEVVETNYVFDGGHEEFGLVGNAGQTEDVPEENKSLLWTLLKQVRPGMDLSKVVLPTFILEPRSFLEKLADYYYHCDIISKAALEDDPLMRMKLILKSYLSGFYKKPKGLKKPYNPILGETFRCCWYHPETDSRTFYIAEQVSHHPPISAFYVTNRKDGFCISGSILAKSKFYGNSISAILEGTARLTLLARGEDYLITFPYAHCKGIFWGPLAFELGGKVTITCEKTGYKSELEFKLKPFFGSEDQCNLLVGKLRLGNETMGSIEGHWDSEIFYKDKRKGETELFWSGIDPKVKSSRLKRYVVPLEEQWDTESEKLWRKVTLAIQKQDQNTATVEKTILEEAQRNSAKQRNSRMELWHPKFFAIDNKINDWLYKMAEMRPWDNRTDVKQYEYDYVIRTLTRHLNSKSLTYVRSANKKEQNQPSTSSEITDGNGNKRRFRRQHTCADPTAIEIPVDVKNDHSPTSKYLSHNFDNLIQKLSSIQDSLEHLNENYKTLETRFNQLSTSFTMSSQSKLLYGESIVKTKPSSTFAITKMHIRLLFESIPEEIRLVLIVLLAHLFFNYLFHT